jgi:drug/metabolite transporter (DMT)-like permease
MTHEGQTRALLKDSRLRAGVVYAILVVLLFAGFIIVSRLGLSTTLKLHDIAALRFGIGAALLLPLIMKKGFGGLRFGQIVTMAVLGGLGFALLAYSGFALAPSSHGGVLLHGTLALTTAVIIRCFGLPRSRSGQGTGLLVVSTGIVCMAYEGWAASSPMMLVGDLCLVGASFCWSGYGLYVRRLHVSAVHAAAIVAVASAAVFLPVYCILPDKMIAYAGWRDLLMQAFFQGVLIGAGSIFIYTRAVLLLGAERMSFFTAAVPSLALLGGGLVLGEPLRLPAVIGVLYVTIGMVIALRFGTPYSPKTIDLPSKARRPHP